MRIRVASRVAVTEAEGPGARFALWVQGCSIRCPGCCNPHFFSGEGGEDMEVEALAAKVACVRADIEGITLLGGEPFEQAEALAGLAGRVRALGLSVMTFSGYRLEELEGGGVPHARELLARTDLLVDGRYEAGLPERQRRWAGSSNQRFHRLTDRYPAGVELVRPGEVERTVEVRLGAEGSVRVNGWPELVGLARARR